MTRKEMFNYCLEMLATLDAIEMKLTGKRVQLAEQVYVCIREVRELKLIAVKETASRPTRQQVNHMQRLMEAVGLLSEVLMPKTHH